MIILVKYASPSAFESTLDEALLALSTSVRRQVRFHGVVRDHGFNLRIALRALGQAIWSNDTWISSSDLGNPIWSNDTWISSSDLLDPIITVHPDRLFFEAFSQDRSVYASLIVDPAIFDTEGEVVTGTTNIDFSAWLWGALGEMRTSRRTSFRIGPYGLEVKTHGAGGRHDRAVKVPESWVRGFLQVQAAMALPGTRIEVKPVDLLAAIRYLRFTKAKMAPRGLRYEFEPGKDARLVLEPWEHVVPLEGAAHNYTEPKVTRVWGRRRLRLIEGLLPFADSVQVYLKGRGLPSFYAVKMAGMTFVLGLSGFSDADFTSSSGFDSLMSESHAGDDLLQKVFELLKRNYHHSTAELAEMLGVALPLVTSVCTRLCRQGRVMFDVESRRYRHRELFEQPIDEHSYFPPDERREIAAQLIEQGQVKIQSCRPNLTQKLRRMKTLDGPIERVIQYRDWNVIGAVECYPEVEAVVNDSGSIIFGRCTCPFFQENLMHRGPCAHILALYQASEGLRADAPASLAAEPEPRSQGATSIPIDP